MKDEELKGFPTEEQIDFVIDLKRKSTLEKGFCTDADIYLAGLKAGRPQWHDLRKDPNDLPKEDRYYLIYTVLGNYYVSKHHHNTNYWIGIQNQFVSIKQVIAWCEIPTFEKE